MSETETVVDRAKRIGQEARLNPKQERQLAATLDRSMAEARASVARDWYSVTKPNEAPLRVHFNPPQTIEEVRTRWYPGCGVLPA